MKHGPYVLMARVTVERLMPLAKGGSVVTAGIVITQKDMKDSHDVNLHEWRNAKGGVELHHDVIGIEYGPPNADGTESILSTKEFWYFPSEDGRPGRGLTEVGGRPLEAKSSNQLPGLREIPTSATSSAFTKDSPTDVWAGPIDEPNLAFRRSLFGGTLPPNVDRDKTTVGQLCIICAPEDPGFNDDETGEPRLWNGSIVGVTAEGFVQVHIQENDGSLSAADVPISHLYLRPVARQRPLRRTYLRRR